MPSIWGSLTPSGVSLENSRGSDQKVTSSEEKRKLIRQRKLGYATDDDVGLNSSSFRDVSLPTPVSSGSGGNGHWSNSAVPQPLPLPEMNFQFPPIGDQPRRSSYQPHQPILKPTDDELRSQTYVPTAYPRRGFPSGLTIDTSEHDLNLHFPARSAPSSTYSSPNLSPPRYSSVHPLNHSLQAPHPFSEGCAAPHSSPRDNPTHSSTSHTSNGGVNSRNRNGVLMHSTNTSVETSLARVDINNTSHRLPLPPALTKPLPVQKSFDRPEDSSAKGQWQKGKLIGHGTYGNVYIATNRETGAICAMKEVEMILDDPKCAESIKQLEQEMKFLRDLRHPNIVQYYGCETIDDRFCIYLEYVHPGPINKYVRENCTVMTESIVRSFTRHILSGLVYLHSKKTIHRDIKGANLLVDAFGVVKLADFGLAKHLSGQNFNLSLKGTPHWIAPEILQPELRKDSNPELAYGVDIWSLGCTVIEMFTGKPPWSEFNEAQAMFNLLHKPPPIPENLSAEGKDFLQKCFQMKPADRPSAANLLDHPFIRSSSEHCAHEFSGRKPNGNESPSESTRSLMPFPSATRIRPGNHPLLLNVETNLPYFLDSPATDPSHRNSSSYTRGLCSNSPEPGRSSISWSPSGTHSILVSRIVPRNIFRFPGQKKA